VPRVVDRRGEITKSVPEKELRKPAGRPVTERVTVPLKPLTRVMVMLSVPRAFCATVRVFAAALSVKPGVFAALITRFTVVVLVMLAELLPADAVPVMLSGYVPAATADVVVILRLEVVVALAGENVPLAPAGQPLADKPTALENPLSDVMVMTSLALAPAVSDTLVAAGDNAKLAAAVMTREIVVVAVVDPAEPVMVSG
jgi:hypothetical protein